MKTFTAVSKIATVGSWNNRKSNFGASRLNHFTTKREESKMVI